MKMLGNKGPGGEPMLTSSTWPKTHQSLCSHIYFAIPCLYYYFEFKSLINIKNKLEYKMNLNSCQEALDADLNNNKSEFSDDDSTDWTDDTIEESIEYPDFPEFDQKIQNALADFGNKVFIKLNWSSPKDAYWALNKLSCDRLSDIYIQLRSSDFINHDLTQVFDNCADKTSIENQSIIKNFQYSLVLRDWLNINSSMEFRCFVHENVLVGVSQRDCRSFYQTLVDNRADILERVSKFYVANIHGKFFDSSYVFDVCSGKVIFSPFYKVFTRHVKFV